MPNKIVYNVKFGTTELVELQTMTPDELADMEAEAAKFEAQERTRPLTESEVSRLLIAQQINTLSVDDTTALRMMSFYPAWTENTAYSVGYKVQRNGKLWRALQSHTAQVGWEPGAVGTESLFEEVCESHEGTLDDPIPYAGNMELLAGLYYCQDYTVYKCTRATEQAVYHKLSELVGTYVEPG